MALTDFVITDAGREMLTRAALEGDVGTSASAKILGSVRPNTSEIYFLPASEIGRAHV